MSTKISFHSLLKSQINALKAIDPSHYNEEVQKQVKSALEWFGLCRLSMYPNSALMLNNGKSVTVARDESFELDVNSYVSLGLSDYLALLENKQDTHQFSRDDLASSDISTLNKLHSEGASQHLLFRMDLFGQSWGAISVSCFNEERAPLNSQELEELHLLCDTWLVYWQHSAVARSYKSHQSSAAETKKLLKLSKKQCDVLTLLSQGFTAKQCAEKMFLSPRTIESHKYRIMDILELDNHTELVQFAVRNGFAIS